MFKLFNHYGRWGAALRLSLDGAFLVVVVLSASRWIERGLPVDAALFAVYVLLLTMTVVGLKAWFNSRQKYFLNPASSSPMRMGLLLYLVVPSAYAISAVLPLADLKRQFLEFSAFSAAFAILATRAMALPAAPAMVRFRVLVFGVGEKALAVEKTLRSSDPAIEIVGFYPSPLEHQPSVPDLAVLPASRSLTQTAVELRADCIVVAVTERRGGAMPLRELLDCKLAGIRVFDLQTYFEQTLGKIRVDSLYAGWLVFGQGFRQGFMRTLVKRLFDVAFASLLLTLALPIMAITALAIFLESGAPILYRQERVGRNGQLFDVIKFRSMRTDAEKDGRPRWASAKDDRVTRVGRIIRKLRIDELPQLLCVLKGDMSLVGPRPERPFFVDRLMREIPFYAVRHSVKPGVTGWAQVRYHYGATVEDSLEKLQYDLYYVKNHSLSLDLLVLFETVGVVLTGKGAN